MQRKYVLYITYRTSKTALYVGLFSMTLLTLKRPVSELGLSAMQEMGNILSGSYLSALSDFTNLKIYPTVPV